VRVKLDGDADAAAARVGQRQVTDMVDTTLNWWTDKAPDVPVCWPRS